MRTIRSVLAGLVVAGGVVLALPGTAHACSCTSADPRTFVERADAVVWAEVTDSQVPVTGAGEAHYLLAVESVYKGRVTERVRVDSEASGAACGLEGITEGRAYAFFLLGDGSPYSANLCGGSGAVERERVERVAGALDPARSRLVAGGPEGLPPSTYAYAGMGVGALAAAVVAALLWFRRGVR